jgi:hypothetical protein
MDVFLFKNSDPECLRAEREAECREKTEEIFLLPMDTLHVMPRGIIRLLRWAVMLMQAANKQELDHRLSKMPPVYDPELRLHWRNFATGTSTMTVLIEYFLNSNTIY